MMDLVLEFLDEYILDDIYAKFLPSCSSPQCPSSSTTPPNSTWLSFISSFPILLPPTTPNRSLHTVYSHFSNSTSAWPRDHLGRQILSLSVVTLIGIHILYFAFAGLSYRFIFNHEMMRHPRFLPNQVRKEIITSLRAFPGMTLLTLPFFLGEVRGWTRLYDNVDDFGWPYLVFSIPLFLFVTDYCIYWIHRWLHLPALYKRLHKPHHKWIIPTPFASHAFHPVDGWAQSIPYHLFILVFPMQHHLYLLLFILVNCWSIFIHDSDMITGHPLENIINGPAHHTLHHLYFICNYGQYFTFADRAGGSYRHPDSALDPLQEVRRRQERVVTREEEEKERREKERMGDLLAEEWEERILGGGGRGGSGGGGGGDEKGAKKVE